MPVFEIQTPDGRTFEIEAPNANAAAQALQSYTAPPASAPEQQAAAPSAPSAPSMLDAMGALSTGQYAPSAADRQAGMIAGSLGTPDTKTGFLQAADDMARIAANAMTFGYADKMAGALSGSGTEAERAATQAARDRAGGSALAMDLTAGGATGVGLANRGLTAMRAVPAGMTGAKGLAARTAAMAADGAAMGGLTAAGYDQPIADGAALGALAGAGGNVAGEALAKGIGKAAGMFNRKPVIPEVDDIRAAKTAAYKRADDAGVVLAQPAMQRLRVNVETALADFGYDPAVQPRVAGLVKAIERYSEQNATFKGLENIRKVAVQLTKSNEASERAAAGRVIEVFDDFVDTLGQSADDVIMGRAKDATAAIKEGRTLARRQAKTELLDAAEYRGDLQASATGSGGNTDNAIRQRVKSILTNPRQARMFSAQERKLMEQIVRGGPTQNLLRLIGKLSPQGSGLMSALAIGGTVANPAVGLAALSGLAAKPVADNMTRTAARRLNEVVRAGSVEAASAPQNALQRLTKAERETLARILGLGGAVGAVTSGGLAASGSAVR